MAARVHGVFAHAGPRLANAVRIEVTSFHAAGASADSDCAIDREDDSDADVPDAIELMDDADDGC